MNEPDKNCIESVSSQSDDGLTTNSGLEPGSIVEQDVNNQAASPTRMIWKFWHLSVAVVATLKQRNGSWLCR
jgi:hypothetical protein